MDGPEEAPSGVGAASLHEALVDTQVVADSVPPGAGGSLVVRVLLEDVGVDVGEEQAVCGAGQQGQGDHLDVGSLRLISGGLLRGCHCWCAADGGCSCWLGRRCRRSSCRCWRRHGAQEEVADHEGGRWRTGEATGGTPWRSCHLRRTADGRTRWRSSHGGRQAGVTTGAHGRPPGGRGGGAGGRRHIRCGRQHGVGRRRGNK